MPAEHDAPPPMIVPTRHQLVKLAAIGAVAAAVVVAGGAATRALHGAQLNANTRDDATPTVSLAKVDYGAASDDLVLPGSVQPFNKAAIYARVPGYLKSWQADIGAKVKAGQVLGLIDTPDLDQQLDQAKADLASATANSRLADLTAKRWNALVGSQAVAQQTADEKTGNADAQRALQAAAAANVRRLETLEGFKRIVAPFDGVVTARNTDIGALINVGAQTGVGVALFDVSDLHRVRIYVEVPQSFAAQIRPGLTATFEVPQYPGRVFQATLVTTSQAMRPGSNTMQVELQADNADGALQAGAYCQVHFAIPGGAHAGRIPATALAPTDRGSEVAVVGAGGKVAFHPITLGRDFGDSVEVTSGITPTDKVIDNPPETLTPGDVVRLAATAPASKPGGSR